LYEVRLVAKVDEPWHIYSQQTPAGGPLPTKISFLKNPLLLPTGKLKEEGDMEIYHENVFDVDVYSYTGKVEFVQVIRLRSPVKTNLAGSVEYMACTHEQCLAPTTYRFNVALN
jgi:thiol:disulfide interchange protein DsbD